MLEMGVVIAIVSTIAIVFTFFIAKSSNNIKLDDFKNSDSLKEAIHTKRELLKWLLNLSIVMIVSMMFIVYELALTNNMKFVGLLAMSIGTFTLIAFKIRDLYYDLIKFANKLGEL
jgi:hypothetical protein